MDNLSLWSYTQLLAPRAYVAANLTISGTTITNTQTTLASFTVPYTGIYLFNMYCNFHSPNTSTYGNCVIQLQDQTTGQVVNEADVYGNANTVSGISYTTMEYCKSGNTYALQAYVPGLGSGLSFFATPRSGGACGAGFSVWYLGQAVGATTI